LTKPKDEIKRLKRIIQDQQKALKRQKDKIRKLQAQRRSNKNKELRNKMAQQKSTYDRKLSEWKEKCENVRCRWYDAKCERDNLRLFHYLWKQAIGYDLPHDEKGGGRILDIEP